MKNISFLFSVLVASAFFVGAVHANDSDNQGDVYNVNVYVDGKSHNGRYHNNTHRYNRYGSYRTNIPYVSHVNGYGYVRSLPYAPAYKSYTPHRKYNHSGVRYDSDTFYKRYGSRYNTYQYGYKPYSTYTRPRYNPYKERYHGEDCFR